MMCPSGNVVLLAALAVVAGCATTPLPTLADGDVPDSWQGPSAAEVSEWPSREWWNNFASVELSDLMDRIEKQNLDLDNNRRNLQRAQLALRDAGFDLWPTPVLEVGAADRYSGQKTGGGEYTDERNGSADLSLGSFLHGHSE